MKKPWNHLSILLLLQLVVFAAHWRITSQPLWNAMDFELLHDAQVLHASLGNFFDHIGNLFSQPLFQLGLLLEYHWFGIEPQGYLILNLALHGLNAFVFYLLVYMLFPRECLAELAALLFALCVGHYGKLLLTISGVESLVTTFWYLTVLYALIRNDFHHDGRIRSPWFLFGLAVFVLAGLTRPVSFSILGGLVAYRFFFYKERGGRGVFPPSLLIVVSIGILLWIAQRIWGWQGSGPGDQSDVGPALSAWYSIKSIFRYLNLMVFPIQASSLVYSSHPAVMFIYEWRVLVRTLVALGIISYSFFGLVFGGKAVRFFIAWTYIAVLPFTVVIGPHEWLNIGYLYLASLGFCVILAAGTVGCIGLLRAHRWRRLVPLLAPLLFALISQTVNMRLAARNLGHADTLKIQQMHEILERQIAVTPTGEPDDAGIAPK